jgi:hypothetical protein
MRIKNQRRHQRSDALRAYRKAKGATARKAAEKKRVTSEEKEEARCR